MIKNRFHAFLDESYGKNDYYIAAIVLEDQQYNILMRNLESIIAHAHKKFNIPITTELHAHRMMHGLAPWECFRGQVHEAVALYRAAARAIRQCGAYLLVEGLDVVRLKRRYKYPDPPYEITLRHLLERIDNLTYQLGKESCNITADLIDRHRDFQEAIEGYTRAGTPGYRSSRLERISQPIAWNDSQDNRGIQAADLLAYIYRRVKEPQPGHSPRAARAASTILRDFGPLYHERKWIP